MPENERGTLQDSESVLDFCTRRLTVAQAHIITALVTGDLSTARHWAIGAKTYAIGIRNAIDDIEEMRKDK